MLYHLVMDLSRAKALISRALAEGGDLKLPGHARWNVAGNCEAPVMVMNTAHAPTSILDEGLDRKVYTSDQGGLVTTDLTVPCRKCKACLRVRARLWRRRAHEEVEWAPRTWFGTLTFRPEARYAVLALAIKRTSASTESWNQLSEAERFRALLGVCSREITLWLKRLRKRGSKLRYLVVAEAHKDGFPHFHLLLHEQVQGTTNKRDLEGSWRVGFSQWRLIERTSERVVNYVTKYLMKSNLARVRASLDYGDYAHRHRLLLQEAVVRGDPFSFTKRKA